MSVKSYLFRKCLCLLIFASSKILQNSKIPPMWKDTVQYFEHVSIRLVPSKKKTFEILTLECPFIYVLNKDPLSLSCESQIADERSSFNIGCQYVGLRFPAFIFCMG